MRDADLEARLGEEVVSDPETARKAGDVLSEALVGHLAMTDADGPYVVPISFAYDGEEIHFHGGEGKKAAALEREPRICLSATTQPRPMKGGNACAFNFDYRSVLAYGTARLLAGPAERDAALRAIIAKYHPETVTAPLDQGMLEKTKVYSLAIRALTYRQHPEV